MKNKLVRGFRTRVCINCGNVFRELTVKCIVCLEDNWRECILDERGLKK